MKLIKATWDWLDDRTGMSTLLGPVFDHPVPAGAKWAYVFGSATMIAFIIQVVTGIALSAAYVTSSGEAYESLKALSDPVNNPLGYLLRGMHFYGASAMVVLVGLHMIQVFLYGAYKFPREMNWLTGVVLFAVTLAMGFTGQLLRWDDVAVWSVYLAASMSSKVPVVGSGIAHFLVAGDTIGGATLSRFFAFHVFFIPALIFVFLGAHLWLVIHHGISEPPEAGRPVDPKTYRAWYHSYLEKHGVPFWPDAAWRDVVFGLGVVVVIMLMAWFWGPPHLGEAPDPSAIEVYPKPDWYLLWIFAALALLPGALEEYVVFIGPLIIGGILVALPFISNRGERSWKRRPWAVASVLIIVLMIGSLWIKGVQAPWTPSFNAQALPAQVVNASTAEVQRGAELFNSQGCQNCHAIAGYGGQRGPSLSNVADRLSREQIAISILNGRRNMPAYATSMSPEDLSALVDFLQTRTAQSAETEHNQAGGNTP